MHPGPQKKKKKKNRHKYTEPQKVLGINKDEQLCAKISTCNKLAAIRKPAGEATVSGMVSDSEIQER